MKAILIPVKEKGKAKQRLAAHLPPEARASLAAAMMKDFFAVVAAARGYDRVYVVSADPEALARARAFNWHVIREPRQLSESDSVDIASEHCARDAVRTLLRLPIDLPLVEPRDIELLLELVPPAPGVVLVPSRDGTGTNALLRTPPDLFPSHFGPGSFARHRAEAERCSAGIRIVRNSRLELDVDVWEDLRALRERMPLAAAVRAWFRENEHLLARAPQAGDESRDAGGTIAVARRAAGR